MRDGSGEEGGVCRWVWMGRDDRVRERGIGRGGVGT